MTLYFPCSHFDLPVSRQGAALTQLDSLTSYDMVIWTDCSVPFPIGKSEYGVLTNCSLCGAEAAFSYSAGPFCSNFSTKAYAILQALRWSPQHHQVCQFSFVPLLFPLDLATLFSPSSFLLLYTLWHICQELSSLPSSTIRLQLVRGYPLGNDTE